jgi:hypothetical protein
MLLKKILLTSAIITTTGMATTVMAHPLDDMLYVFNNTDKPSSVMITSNPAIKKLCAPKSTPAHSESETQGAFVRALCGPHQTSCDVELFTSSNCMGEHIADLTINTDNLFVTYVKLYDKDHYDVVPTGSTVNINQIK